MASSNCACASGHADRWASSEPRASWSEASDGVSATAFRISAIASSCLCVAAKAPAYAMSALAGSGAEASRSSAAKRVSDLS